MKQLTRPIIITLILLCLFWACQKEYSVETGVLGSTAHGTLSDDSLGNCQNITIKGSYLVGTSLTDSNYALINVNFTTQGKYLIGTDTVNGMWFLDSGYAFSTGAAVLKVPGNGKPLLGIPSTFTVSLDSNYCSFSITPQ